MILITGLPAAGKTTLASKLEEFLERIGKRSIHLDGIELRRIFKEFNYDERGILEFSHHVKELLKLLCSKGFTVILSMVLPLEKARKEVLSACDKSIVILLKCEDLQILRSRDFKGVYELADNGEVILPGYSIPLEEPINPDLTLDTCSKSVDESFEEILYLLRRKEVI